VQQEINNHTTELFKQVLASGAKLTDTHTGNLETLLFSFPQCGVLHAIQARSGNAQQLNEAAAWFCDSATLQKAVKAPDSLPVVNVSQIVIKTNNAKVEPVEINTQAQTVEIAEVKTEATEPEVETYYEIINEEELNPNSQVKPEPEKFTKPIFKEEPFDETQQLIIENIAANDYFVFDKAFRDRNQTEPEAIETEPAIEPVAKPAEPAKPAAKPPVPEEGGVTRYHDDKMPYSFMWWLDKTRNKHSGVYQPFANPVPPAQPAPENHIKEIFEEHSKEEELIERFIQEEPQIKPQSGDKLDNENKAKQSAEDQEELITETLARIYADQMLYSKAIAAYKILMLKNPEKRRYFASQIENLQKKIN